MGRPFSFGSHLQGNRVHSHPDVVERLAGLTIGDIVRLSVDIPVSDRLELRRCASTYGLMDAHFRRNQYYIIAHAYTRKISVSGNVIASSSVKETAELKMLVALPMENHGSNSDTILTWLVDTAGWIRCAEDFSISDEISSIVVIGKLQPEHPLYPELLKVSFTESGDVVAGASSVFTSNDFELIQSKHIMIPYA